MGMVVKFASLSNRAKVPIYNYAFIESFRRYYFITEWAWSQGFWYATFAEDVLATKRDEILSSDQYVIRSATPVSLMNEDTGLIDTKYPTTADIVTRTSQTLNKPLGIDIRDGYYIIGVINDLGREGSVTYYALPPAAFRSLCNEMLSSISWANIDVNEISDGLQKALINPMQYIVSCIRFPYNTFGGTQTTTIRLGWWSFTVTDTCWIVRSIDQVQYGFYLDIYKHTNAARRGKYLNLSPFSKYTLTFLPFGVFDLDTTDLCGNDYLHLDITANVATGDAVLEISASTRPDTRGAAFITVNSNIGVQIPTGQIAANLNNIDQALTYAGVVGGVDIIGNALNGTGLAPATSSPVSSPTGRGGGGVYGGGGGRR